MKKPLIIAALVLVPLLIIILVFIGCTGKSSKTPPATINLTWWGVFEEQDAYQGIINDYQTIHPYIKITYKKMRFENYEEELRIAWSRDEGPDIFNLHNTWVTKYQPDIEPLPPETEVAYITTQKRLRFLTETLVEYKKNKSLTPQRLKSDFVDVVYEDAVIENEIYGLPFNLDTLVMFYNRDLLNKAHIPLPPQTWREFAKQVPQLTLQDGQGNIVQAGAALGTAKNIPRAVDIISLLMLQNGTQMVSPDGQKVTFHEAVSTSNGDKPVGQEALEFYTDFASPAKEVYTWNNQMSEALEAFTQGKLAFFFGYSYQIPLIKSRGAGLNWGVSPMPQIDPVQETNYANYWLTAVAKKSKHTNEAWDFVQFASQKEHVGRYLNETKKPTALKSLINAQIEEGDPELEPIVHQVLTAKNWYHGRDPVKMEEFLAEMIDQVVGGEMESGEAIRLAAQQIKTTL